MRTGIGGRFFAIAFKFFYNLNHRNVIPDFFKKIKTIHSAESQAVIKKSEIELYSQKWIILQDLLLFKTAYFRTYVCCNFNFVGEKIKENHSICVFFSTYTEKGLCVV